MKLLTEPGREQWAEVCRRPQALQDEFEERVKPILADIKAKGDAALKEYVSRFEGLTTDNLFVSQVEIAQAEKQLTPELAAAIRQAYQNIYTFHASQKEQATPVETMPGVLCWRKPIPISRVGLYVPGGTAPLFSTALMLGIPARIAGCATVVLATPAQKDGHVHPAVLFAASLCGITQIIKAGGAQAIAALAYGTETIPSVYKIFGPGNPYVTTAKMLVAREGVGIDMPAGPSEVLVYADDTARPAFVAADLLSQAEHGVDSQVVLVCSTQAIAQAVMQEVEQQLQALPRAEVAAKALENSFAVVMQDKTMAMELINAYAPEHLILCTDNADEMAAQVTEAGSVFLGHYTPESAGDYASGTNHTLPTGGYARLYAGVSLDSFVKKMTFQRITPEGLKTLGPVVETMAAAEQLEAHKNAVSLRLKALE